MRTVNCSSVWCPFVFFIVLNISIMLTVTTYRCLKRQWLFPFLHICFISWFTANTLLGYIWVQLGMLNKKQKCLEQRQANENKNTENWKMSMDTIEKTGLTQVLANVGHNGCFTSTFLDICCLKFIFKHSINYEINKIRKGENTVWLRVY